MMITPKEVVPASGALGRPPDSIYASIEYAHGAGELASIAFPLLKRARRE